jgi:hypothetical protein
MIRSKPNSEEEATAGESWISVDDRGGSSAAEVAILHNIHTLCVQNRKILENLNMVLAALSNMGRRRGSSISSVASSSGLDSSSLGSADMDPTSVIEDE